MAKAYFHGLGHITKDLSLDKEYQKQDIDLMVTTPSGEVATFEVKYDEKMHKTGNLFAEHISCVALNSPGWLEKTRCDFVFYIDAISKTAHVIGLDELKLIIELADFPIRTAKDYRKDGSYKESAGFCVPISHIKYLTSYRSIKLGESHE